jgi:two-component system cell cycle sensor histidine kinase/response regulator CckA
MNERTTVAVAFANAADQKLAAGHLSALGYDIADFRRGVPPADLYILDTPSARQFGRQVLAIKRAAEVFVPVMIALARSDPYAPWLAFGFDFCFRMPTTKEKLQTHVKILLRLRRQSQELEQVGEQKYRAIFHSVSSAVMLVAEDGAIVMANQECSRLTGRSPEELVGTKWTAYLAPESLPEALRYLQARRDNPAGPPVQCEARILHKAGKALHAALTFGLMPSGKQCIISMTDLTQQVAAQEALRRSEALFRSNFENHTAAKLMIDPDTGKIVDANRAAAAFYGWPREKLTQMHIWDINTAPLKELVRLMKETKERKRGAFEFRHRLADGSLRDVLVYTALIEAGDKAFLHWIIHDITERKRAQVALEKSEEKFRNITKVISDYAYAFRVTPDKTLEGEWLSESFTKVFGFSREEIDARGGWKSMVYPADLPSMEQHALKVASGTPDVCECRFVAKDGTIRWIRDYATPVWDEQEQRVVRIYGAAQDFTEQRRATEEQVRLREQLQHAQRLESIGRLAGGVAHDFNNMLTVILGYGEAILQRLRQGDPLRQPVEEIVKAGRRSAALTRQLLAFSRKQTLQPRTLDLNHLLRNLESMLQRLIGEDIVLELALAANLPAVTVGRWANRAGDHEPGGERARRDARRRPVAPRNQRG